MLPATVPPPSRIHRSGSTGMLPKLRTTRSSTSLLSLYTEDNNPPQQWSRNFKDPHNLSPRAPDEDPLSKQSIRRVNYRRRLSYGAQLRSQTDLSVFTPRDETRIRTDPSNDDDVKPNQIPDKPRYTVAAMDNDFTRVPIISWIVRREGETAGEHKSRAEAFEADYKSYIYEASSVYNNELYKNRHVISRYFE